MRAASSLLLAILVTAAGCSGERPAETPATGSVTAAGGTSGIDPASRLDLDSGRVSVFSPRGWRRAPRSYDYLVRYQPTAQLAYPSVVVIAADPPAGLTEVTAANHAAFAEGIAAALAAAGKPLLRKPSPIQVGPHRGAAWSAAGEAKLDGPPQKIERECLAVVIGGRLYTVEAWAPRGKLTDAGRAAARAVAAALALPTLEPLESLEPLLPAEPEPTGEPVEPATAPADGEPQAEDAGPVEPEPAAAGA